MDVIEVASGLRKMAIISIAKVEDYRILTKRRYSFTWKDFKAVAEVYKLQVDVKGDILGVIGIVDVPGEKRMEIKLLASSKENIGDGKAYERIAGCLIAFTCRRAVSSYGAEACVSLVPKTELAGHYMRKYYMLNAGRQLYLEGKVLYRLLNEYL